MPAHTHPCPTCIYNIFAYTLSHTHFTHILYICSFGLGDDINQSSLSCSLSGGFLPVLLLHSTAHHFWWASPRANPLPTCSSPYQHFPLTCCLPLPSLSHTEQLSCLKKLSLTHPTSSLPSSRHRLATLCIHRRKNLHLHHTWVCTCWNVFLRGSILRQTRRLQAA